MQTQHAHTQALQEKPLVSFIITAYNLPAEMLRECIGSVLALPLGQHERQIILIDDGSDTSALDGLDGLCEEILYIRQANQGLSVARNTGLDIAKGTFIQFLDGDDLLIPDAYGHCLDLARQQDTDMVIFDFTDKPKSAASHRDEAPVQGAELMKRQNIRGTAWGYLFRRSVLGGLRFTRGIYHEDEEFTPLLLLRAENVRQTDAKAYFYRKRDGSITTDKAQEKVEKRLNDMKNTIFRLNEQADRMPTADRQAMQRRVAQLTMDYIYNVIVETRDRKILDEQLAELEKFGLFPLPDRNYTKKYSWFRRMTNSKAGLRMLMLALPVMKRER